GRPGELGPDASLLLPEVHQLVAGMHAARAEPREDCAMENAQQLAPVDRELWPAVTRGEAARLGPDPLSVPGVIGKLGGRDAGGAQRFRQAQLGQFAHRVGRMLMPTPSSLTAGADSWISTSRRPAS